MGWSYALLTGAERLLLDRLSVFAGSFDLGAAEAVCGSGGIDVLDADDLLGSLVDKSLVVAEPAGETLRYRLLETIRLFAAERLADAGDDEAAAVAAAHCAHFLAVAEAAAPHLTGPEQGSWLARLDADQANLRRGVRWCCRGQAARAAPRWCCAWASRSAAAGTPGPGCRRASGCSCRSLRRPDSGADPALFGAALVTAANVACYIDVATARHLAEQAVELARKLGDDRLLVRSLAALCAAHYFTGEPETGRPFGQEAVERARRLGDDVLLGRSLRGYLSTIGPARSGPLFTEAIACTERSGDHLINSMLHNNASGAALEAGDIPAARAHLEAAVQAAQQIGFEHVSSSLNLGWVQRAEGDLDGAQSTVEAALRIGRRNGDNWHMAYAILGLACLAGDAGDWGPGSHAPRRRAGPSGPDRQSVARWRCSLPPGQPGPSACTPRR